MLQIHLQVSYLHNLVATHLEHAFVVLYGIHFDGELLGDHGCCVVYLKHCTSRCTGSVVLGIGATPEEVFVIVQRRSLSLPQYKLGNIAIVITTYVASVHSWL